MRIRACRCRKKIGLRICGRSIFVRARQAGDAKVSQARATESGARERFVSAYDGNIGTIRQTRAKGGMGERRVRLNGGGN